MTNRLMTNRQMISQKLLWVVLPALLPGCSGTRPLEAVDTGPGDKRPVADRAVLQRGLPDLEGRIHDLLAPAQNRKCLVLVFWQPWCQSCKDEAPSIVQATRRFGDRAAFFGVVSGPAASVDMASVRECVTTLGLDYPQVRDTSLEITRGLHVARTPTIVVLGPNLEQRYRGHQPPSDWNAVLF